MTETMEFASISNTDIFNERRGEYKHRNLNKFLAHLAQRAIVSYCHTNVSGVRHVA